MHLCIQNTPTFDQRMTTAGTVVSQIATDRMSIFYKLRYCSEFRAIF